MTIFILQTHVHQLWDLRSQEAHAGAEHIDSCFQPLTSQPCHTVPCGPQMPPRGWPGKSVYLYFGTGLMHGASLIWVNCVCEKLVVMFLGHKYSQEQGESSHVLKYAGKPSFAYDINTDRVPGLSIPEGGKPNASIALCANTKKAGWKISFLEKNSNCVGKLKGLTEGGGEYKNTM